MVNIRILYFSVLKVHMFLEQNEQHRSAIVTCNALDPSTSFLDTE
jgi:hypothetical protein